MRTALETSGQAAEGNGGLASGYCVQLEVSDTGCGMPQETLAKIFDPFFSSKGAGHGLGLAVVHGIVRSLGGTIHVTTEPNKGTKFQVCCLVPEPRSKKAGARYPPTTRRCIRLGNCFC